MAANRGWEKSRARMVLGTPTTLAPAARKASVTKLPRPPLAPVISAVLPSNGFMKSLLYYPNGVAWLSKAGIESLGAGALFRKPLDDTPAHEGAEHGRKRHAGLVILALALSSTLSNFRVGFT